MIETIRKQAEQFNKDYFDDILLYYSRSETLLILIAQILL